MARRVRVWGLKGRGRGILGISLVAVAIGTMVFSPYAAAASDSSWSTPYYGQTSGSQPCQGSVWQSSDAYTSTGVESVGVWDDSNASSFCQLFGSNGSYENANAGLHGDAFYLSGSATANYNVYFDYSITITAFLGGNCAGSGNFIERIWFVGNLWDDNSGTNIWGPNDFQPSQLTGSTCSSNNVCDHTFNFNETVSLPGGSGYQPRVATDAGVYVGVGDWLNTNTASANANSGTSNGDCGRDDGATLTSISMYGEPGSGVTVTDPSNSTARW
jgi:hypothetical protein